MINLRPLLQKYWDVMIDGNDIKRINSQTAPEGVEVTEDVHYVNDDKWQHLLDIYRPENTDKPLPIIIDIHGGGWMYGTKLINKYYNMTLAQKGYTVFSINYHLVPESDIGVQLQDCMLAFKWIKENAKEQLGDLNEVYVTGDSAGGFLAAFSTLLNNSEKLRKVYNTVSPELIIRGVGLVCPVCYLDEKGAVGMYGKQILGNDYKNKSYYGYVNLDSALECGDMPPTFLVTTDGDLPAKKATLKAYDNLQEYGVKCELKYLPDKKLPHVFCITDPFRSISASVNNAMLKFFQDNK